MRMRQRVMVMVWVTTVPAMLVAQAQAPLVVGAVDVQGSRRYAATDVIRISGVTPGQSLSVADLDTAVNRMAATGLFAQVAYRYLTRAGKTTVTFDIVEPEWTMPVEFDNFVWFNDETLIAAMRERVPSFDGTAPILNGFSDLLTSELQQFLKSRNIEGTVIFLPQGTLGKDIDRYMFKVSSPAPRLCTLSFPGAAAISEGDLKSAMGLSPNADHSVALLRSISQGTLTNQYRQRGFWKAGFSAPRVTYVQGEQCSGAAVTVAVDEGAAYALDHNEWTGNAQVPTGQLDALGPLKRGAPAGIGLIEDAVRRVQRAYGAQGYIMARTTYEMRLDDASKTAVVAFTIDEGLQFRMGSLTFSGLDPAGTATLSKEWRLKPGEVYDAEYPGKFTSEKIHPRLRPGVKPPALRLALDQEKRLVNVEIAFGS